MKPTAAPGEVFDDLAQPVVPVMARGSLFELEAQQALALGLAAEVTRER